MQSPPRCTPRTAAAAARAEPTLLQKHLIVFQSLVITLARRANDAVWCQGREGAEQQCRKRGGSSKDGGVTPLKVKLSYYHVNNERFAPTARHRVPPQVIHLAACRYGACSAYMSFCGGEYGRTLLFGFGMAAVFQTVFFSFSANIQYRNAAPILRYGSSAPCVPSVAAPPAHGPSPPPRLRGWSCCSFALSWLQQRFPLSVELTADGSASDSPSAWAYAQS